MTLKQRKAAERQGALDALVLLRARVERTAAFYPTRYGTVDPALEYARAMILGLIEAEEAAWERGEMNE